MAKVAKHPSANASIMTAAFSENQERPLWDLKDFESHDTPFLDIGAQKYRPMTTRDKSRPAKPGKRNAMTQRRAAHGRIPRMVCRILLKLGRCSKENCASSMELCKLAAED